MFAFNSGYWQLTLHWKKTTKMIILKTVRDLTLMENILHSELPHSVKVKLLCFFFSLWNIFVWWKRTLSLIEYVDIAWRLLRDSTLLNIVSAVICVPFSGMASSFLFLSFFPCCVVFCVPGSWRSVAYPPQQLVSSGDACWLLAYIHYCHLLPSKTGIAHRDKDNL